MKKKYFIFIIVFVLSCSFLLSGIHVKEGEIWGKEILKFNGDEILIEGKVEKDITVIAGKLIIKGGTVDSDIIALWSNIKIEKGSEIKGDIFLIGGEFKRDKESNIKGQITEFQSLKEIRNIVTLGGTEKEKISFKIITIFLTYLLWLVMAIIAYSFMPIKIDDISQKIKKKMFKSLWVGFIFLLLVFLLILFLGIVSLFIIGIPFLLLAILFVFIIKIIGRTSLAVFLGSKIITKKTSPMIIISLGMLLIMIIKYLPFHFPYSFLVTILFDSISFGAVFLYFREKRRIKS